MARCANCNKSVSLEFQEPEVEDDPQVDSDGEVTCSVRLVRTSECCGDELKTATLEMSGKVIIPDEHKDHDLGARVEQVSQVEEGGGRYAKSYFGAEVEIEVHCACQDVTLANITLTDKIAASEMDEEG